VALLLLYLCKLRDHLAQDVQRFVNVDALTGLLACRASLTLLFGTSKIDKLQFAYRDIDRVPEIL
jgi:hypothetical protein